MSPHEIRVRLADELFLRYEEALHKAGLSQPNEARLSRVNGEALDLSRWWLDDEGHRSTSQLIHELSPAYARSVVEEADALMKGQVSFFGRRFPLPTHPAWQSDPVSGTAWPHVFHTRVNIFGGDVGHGDVKYVWELNRFQYLPTLGKAWRLTGDERFATRAIALIRDWIEANPYKIGINWASMLELSVRSLAWLHTLALVSDAPALAAARKSVTASLLMHGQCIHEHLSTYFSPYNHLVGEAAALYAIGRVISTADSQKWADTGSLILEREEGRQWYADGGSVEQASGYHHFTLGFYLQKHLLQRQERAQASSDVALERAFDFTARLIRPDGRLPMLGDADEGKALSLQQHHPWDFRSYLAVGASLFRRADWKALAGPHLPVDALWLVGPEGLQAYDSLTPSLPQAASGLLRASGYAVMRSGWDRDANYLLFDCGELADGVRTDDVSSAAHGHADALSIELTAFGTPLLVDPGFYTYNGPLPWHTYFRDTHAHNALTVDGRSQAVFRGRLKWSHGPHVSIGHWFTSPIADSVSASHDAWNRADGDIVHTRGVLYLKPGLWIIRDEVSGSGEHDVARHWHCTVPPVPSGSSSFDLTAGSAGLLSVAWAETQANLVLSTGADVPDGGWMATGYELREPAPSATVAVRVQLPAVLYTVLQALPGDSQRWVIDSDVRSTGISMRRGEELLVCAYGRQGDTVQTDAEVAWLATDAAGAHRAGIVNGTLVSRGDHQLALSGRGCAAAVRVGSELHIHTTRDVAYHGFGLAPHLSIHRLES